MEFSYVSMIDTTWKCVKCGRETKSELSNAYDQKGRITVIYTPSSRYWLPGIKPGLTAGVFCGVECATNHYGGLVGPVGPVCPVGPVGPVGPTCPMGTFVSANNENPEGL